jgi:hypothetical protein
MKIIRNAELPRYNAEHSLLIETLDAIRDDEWIAVEIDPEEIPEVLGTIHLHGIYNQRKYTFRIDRSGKQTTVFIHIKRPLTR